MRLQSTASIHQWKVVETSFNFIYVLVHAKYGIIAHMRCNYAVHSLRYLWAPCPSVHAALHPSALSIERGCQSSAQLALAEWAKYTCTWMLSWRRGSYRFCCTVLCIDIANLSMSSNLSVCVSIYKSNIQQSMPSNVHCKDHQQSIAALRGLPSSLRLAAIDSQNPITCFSEFPFSLSTCTLEVTVL